VTSQDPAVGAAVYAKLQGLMAPPELQTTPQPKYMCDLSSNEGSIEEAEIPKLLRAYLATGARICGVPAMDREFGTIDFLTLLDLANFPKGMFAPTTTPIH
jgi:putative hemolysin